MWDCRNKGRSYNLRDTRDKASTGLSKEPIEESGIKTDTFHRELLIGGFYYPSAYFSEIQIVCLMLQFSIKPGFIFLQKSETCFRWSSHGVDCKISQKTVYYTNNGNNDSNSLEAQWEQAFVLL